MHNDVHIFFKLSMATAPLPCIGTWRLLFDGFTRFVQHMVNVHQIYYKGVQV